MTPSISSSDDAKSEQLAQVKHAHEDLLFMCASNLERGDLDDGVSNAEELYTLAETFTRMLVVEEQSERLKAVEQVLRQQPNCGFAYVVLAREGAKDSAEIELHYEKALQLLRDECARHEKLQGSESEEDALTLAFEPYVLDEYVWEVIASEHMRVLWNHGKKHEALEKALQYLQETDKFDSEVTPLAMSWLIQSGREQEAAPLLRRHKDSSIYWLYLNALILFNEEGDSPKSRAALEEAFVQSRDEGTDLIRDDLVAPDSPAEYDFSSTVHPAWQFYEGALSWLEKMLNMKYPPVDFTVLPSEADAEKSDRSRFKRWKDLFEHAQKLIDRKDWAEAKRVAKKALREAERFEPVGQVLDHTVRQLIDVYKQLSPHDDEIAVLLRAQTALLHAAASHDSNLTALFELHEMANTYAEQNMLEDAIALERFVVTRYEGLLNQGNQHCDPCGLGIYYSELGRMLHHTQRFADAESCLKRVLELQEQYLGEDHPLLVIGMSQLAQCLLMQDKEDEAVPLFQKILVLDRNGDLLRSDPFGDEDEDDEDDEDDDDDDEFDDDDDEFDEDDPEDAEAMEKVMSLMKKIIMTKE